MNDRIEPWLPVSHWATRHSRAVAAPPGEVARALREVTAGEMRVMRPLIAMRTLPSRLFAGDSAPRPAPAGATMDMTRMGFIPLEDRPGGELILGWIGQPWKPVLSQAVLTGLAPGDFLAFDRPGYIKGVYALWPEPDGAGALFRTETRVYATDRAAARRFRPYWLLIEPFSGLIRRDLLAAVGRRAERSDRSGGPDRSDPPAAA
ncbi:hypothetical protein [Streptomyces sp. CAU 1734]|uniref:hypothetical protein n=1 Tax=Streptomyces sp. CAU 1734 TaxID=3140360 RepID=UPI0032616933